MYLLRQRHRVHYIHLSTTHMNTLVETLSVVTSFTINPQCIEQYYKKYRASKQKKATMNQILDP